MKPLNFFIFLFAITNNLYSQSELLDSYVQQAIDNNEIIKQQNFNLEKSVFALKEASGLFAPSINLQGNYVASKGGRTIDFPIGDIVNPVYNNLNQINNTVAPGSPQYPSLENVSEQLNPNNFYNAYVRTTLPIINAEIWYNRKIKKEQVTLQETEVVIYKRELVKNVKVAYFNYLNATQAVNIYKNALQLVKESERVNTKLYENGKEAIYAVSRSQSEVSKIETKQNEAENMQKNAMAYFNFLLNKALDAEITIDNALLNNVLPLPPTPSNSSDKREELNKLTIASNINQNVLRLNSGAWIPKIGAQLDLGSQAFDFEYNKQSRYYLLGLSFDWSFFSGWKNIHKKKQTQLEIQVIDSQTKYVTEQLKLVTTTASNSYNSAIQQYQNAIKRETTSNQYFSFTEKRYKQGTSIYIEYLDAQNEKILASLQKNIEYFNAWIKLAELERANASFNINN